MTDSSKREGDRAPLEKGERLLWDPEDDVEAEPDLRGYYPHAAPGLKLRDWDEPPWGHKEGARDAGGRQG